jgi:hypothetical protein
MKTTASYRILWVTLVFAQCLCAQASNQVLGWDALVSSVKEREDSLSASSIAYLQITSNDEGRIYAVDAVKVHVRRPFEKWVRHTVHRSASNNWPISLPELAIANLEELDEIHAWQLFDRLCEAVPPSIDVLANGRTLQLSPSKPGLWEGQLTAAISNFSRRGGLLGAFLYGEEWLSDALAAWDVSGSAVADRYVLRQKGASATHLVVRPSTDGKFIALLEKWNDRDSKVALAKGSLGSCRLRVRVTELGNQLPSRLASRLHLKAECDVAYGRSGDVRIVTWIRSDKATAAASVFAQDVLPEEVASLDGAVIFRDEVTFEVTELGDTSRFMNVLDSYLQPDVPGKSNQTQPSEDSTGALAALIVLAVVVGLFFAWRRRMQ